MLTGRLVAVAELVVRLGPGTVDAVAGDRRDEERDRDERGDRVDERREVAELDEDREEQRREAVQQRGAVGDIDVGMRASLRARRHLPVLPDADQQRPEEDQPGGELVARAGRIDRLGSSYDVLTIFNMFPEKELEQGFEFFVFWVLISLKFLCLPNNLSFDSVN